MLQEFAGVPKAFQVGFQFIISPIWVKGKFAGKPMKTLYTHRISPVKTVVSCRFSQNQPIEKIGSRIGR